MAVAPRISSVGILTIGVFSLLRFALKKLERASSTFWKIGKAMVFLGEHDGYDCEITPDSLNHRGPFFAGQVAPPRRQSGRF